MESWSEQQLGNLDEGVDQILEDLGLMGPRIPPTNPEAASTSSASCSMTAPLLQTEPEGMPMAWLTQPLRAFQLIRA